ncbi:MAG TPA: hypothetical protein VGT99_02360 [Gammaproteobacteria bacterium]|nr:hypothetical protein [Gammaproteobacteria bacterium]
MQKLSACLTGFILLCLTACATIVGSEQQHMLIASTPDKASIKIIDEKSAIVFEGTTPTTVSLAKSDGSYFGGKTYTVTVSKDGFASQVIIINHHANGWYLFGNIMLGGVIGYVAVDPFHGGMYTLTPDSVNAMLSPATPAPAAATGGQKTGYNYKAGALYVTLLRDVPAELRGKLVRIDAPAGN